MDCLDAAPDVISRMAGRISGRARRACSRLFGLMGAGTRQLRASQWTHAPAPDTSPRSDAVRESSAGRDA